MNNKENNAVWNIAKKKGLPYAYLGLVMHKDKKFYTVHGVKPAYTNWHQGQPDNLDSGSEKCTQFHNTASWNNIPCSYSYHFICQQPTIKRK